MANTPSKKFIISSIYSGAGIGLLLGLIMGISIEPVVKTVIVVLTGMLGALLGLENKIDKKEPNDVNTTGTNLKLGSFGFAVVAGILFGISVRTYEFFSPTIVERVQAWEDAGYDSISARKYVLYRRLGIDPKTGEATIKSGTFQRQGQTVLFNAIEAKQLSTALDTTNFGGDINLAIGDLKSFENPALDDLLTSAKEILPTEDHMLFLQLIKRMAYKSQQGNSYCPLPEDMNEWLSDFDQELSIPLREIDAVSRKVLLAKIGKFSCQLKTN